MTNTPDDPHQKLKDFYKKQGNLVSPDAAAECEFSKYGVASRMASDMYGLYRRVLPPAKAAEQVRGAFSAFNPERKAK